MSARGYALHIYAPNFTSLMTVVPFSDRTDLEESWKVQKIQEGYVETLQAYTEAKFGKATKRFAQLLMKLTDLRTLAEEHIKQLTTFKMDMPPLLTEFFLHS